MSASDLDPASLDVGPLTPDAFRSCQAIFDASYRDLRLRYGLAVDDPSAQDWLAPVLGHLLDTDPSGSRIAIVDGEPTAFGCSIRRDPFWFLSFLFVMPQWQGRGIGRALLHELLPEDGAILATVV